MRPRKLGNKALPANLYRKLDKRTGKVYYTYRNPQTGKDHGLGTDPEAAVNDAHSLNSTIYQSIKAAVLLAIVKPKTDAVTIETVFARHLKLIESRGLAPRTLKNKKTFVNSLKLSLGKDTIFSSVTVRDIVEILNNYEDRPGALIGVRAEAIDIWKNAIQEGWADDNIPLKTRNKTNKVKRSRLTLEDFKRIHVAALDMKQTWLARAMELALVSAQRVSDIAVLEFRQRKNSTAWIDGDNMCVMQIKSGYATKLRIPLSVGLNDWSIGNVIKSCRDNIATNWVIHHSAHRVKALPGDKVRATTIATAFADARNRAGIAIEKGRTPTTFHEIRSLAIRMYKEKYGNDFGQAIAGHKNAATSALYSDLRGAEWIQVKVG